MPTRRALLVPAALTLALTVPAPPAQALPGCGGNYVVFGSCTFTAPFGSAIVVKATAATNGRSVIAKVAVGAYAGSSPIVSCGRSDLLVASCTDAMYVFPGSTYTCRVSGYYAGTFSCGAVPYYW